VRRYRSGLAFLAGLLLGGGGIYLFFCLSARPPEDRGDRLPPDKAAAFTSRLDEEERRELQQIWMDRALAEVADLTEGREWSIARDLVQSAGCVGDRRFVPQLKEIARRESLKPNREMLTFDALYALWLLGEPREYFLENVRSHRGSKYLAYYSLYMLAYEPDEKMVDELNSIGRETTDELIGNFINGGMVFSALGLADDYAKLKTPEEKVEYLLDNFGGGWGPTGGMDNDPNSSHDPAAVWARRTLFRLSREAPEVVAQAVAGIDISGHDGAQDYLRDFQECVVHFICAEARTILERLERERERRGESPNSQF